MMNIGLTLHDLNFYDGSSEILIVGMQHAKQLQAAIDKVNFYFYFTWINKTRQKTFYLL